MIACKFGFHKIVKFIMENSDTDINLALTDQASRTVFHHAAKHDETLSVMIDICRRTVCMLSKIMVLFVVYVVFEQSG